MKNLLGSKNIHALRASLAIFVLAIFMGFGAACGDDTNLVAEGCDAETLTCESRVFLQVNEFEFLRENGALVLDARAANTFVDGHVPGAVNASWRIFVDPERNGILLDSEAELEAAARALGIDNETTVLIYGDGGTSDSAAGRLLWTLEYLGHSRVYLLDGGIEAWKMEAAARIGSGEQSAPAEGNFTINVRPELRATIDEVVDAMENGTLKLVDTRTIDEWIAENLRDNPQGGAIPTAVHYHWEDVIGEDGRLRPAEEVRAELEALGIIDGTLTIPYCQSGVRSGYFYAVLKWLGYPDAKNYDGSWWEWSRTDGLPIAEHELESSL